MTTNPPESKFPTKAILGALLALVITLAALFGITAPDAPADTVNVSVVVAPVEADTDTDVAVESLTEPVDAAPDAPVAVDAAVVAE